MEYVAVVFSLISLLGVLIIYSIFRKIKIQWEENKKIYDNYGLFLKEANQLYKDIRATYSEMIDHIEEQMQQPGSEKKVDSGTDEVNHIRLLIKKGYNTDEIAQILGKGKGEVKLIMELNNLI
ncbi:MAG: hypothetical protein PHP06_03820 [Clostridia bacterium]|nr:hypothetical protein [Clostridia bacterium]